MCDEDIVVILSNLLNNAIEACEKCSGKKFMKMKLVKEKDNIIISVKKHMMVNLILKMEKYRPQRNMKWMSMGLE